MRGNRLNLVLLVLMVVALVSALAVGRDVRQPNYESAVEGQMGHSPAYGSLAPNPNFPDGITQRVPPPGTIARGQLPLLYTASLEDALRAGQDLRNPFSVKNEDRRRRGAAVFAHFCQTCHGPFGQGDGPNTQGGFPPPPSLAADRAVRMPDGQIFHVLTYGQGRMAPVAPQLSADDRWCAILHVRQLQQYQGPSGRQAPLTYAEVAQIFRQNCVACHGEDGSGKLMRKFLPNIPDFTDLAWQTAQTETAIVNQIDYGSLPLMPAFRHKLKRDEIIGLAVYVRSFPIRLEGRPAPATFLKPVEVYQTYCFACHDSDGRGDPFWRKLAPAIPDFTSDKWQKAQSDQTLAQSILLGKGKYMLPMSDRLGPTNVQDMVAIVREFRGGAKKISWALPKPAGPPPTEQVAEVTPEIVAPSGPAREFETPLPVPSRETAARVRMGMVLFRQFCMTCHDRDGTGNVQRANLPPIPNFRDADWHKKKSDGELLSSIMDGKGTLMPANSYRLNRDQARDLVAVVRSFGPATVSQGPAPVGNDQFERSFRQLQQQWDALEKSLKELDRKSGGK
jgi:mono/diheme cytochrome c family protein